MEPIRLQSESDDRSLSWVATARIGLGSPTRAILPSSSIGGIEQRHQRVNFRGRETAFHKAHEQENSNKRPEPGERHVDERGAKVMNQNKLPPLLPKNFLGEFVTTKVP